MPAFVDLAGQKYGRLTAIKRVPGPKQQGARWLCQCDCGSTIEVRSNSLRTGITASCGCWMRDRARETCIARNTTHGHSGKKRTRTYRIWGNLCVRHHRKCYKNVAICDRWRSFESFLADMGECPSDKHTLERIDNSKGYEPSNCCWATMKEQQNNRTNNRRIAFNGETLTLMQWSERTGIAPQTLRQRLDKLEWSVDRALTAPVRPLTRQ